MGACRGGTPALIERQRTGAERIDPLEVLAGAAPGPSLSGMRNSRSCSRMWCARRGGTPALIERPNPALGCPACRGCLPGRHPGPH